MKKLLIATLSLLFTLPTFAQRNQVDDMDRENFFRFGAKAGFNVNKIPYKSYKQAFNYNYQLGGFLQFNFSSRFGIQPEVNFVQASSETSKDVSSIFDDLFRDGTQRKSRLNFLEVPVLLNINLGQSKHIKLQVGPSYGHLLSHTLDTAKIKGNEFKNGELSAIGGLWIQLPFVTLGGR